MKTLFQGSSPLIAAHRGFAQHHPENTLPAFDAALKLGADLLETDVRGTSEGGVIVAHDPDLMRLAGRPEKVGSLSVAQLQAIDLGGASMPTLDELLDAFPDARISIDIKDVAAVRPTVEAIRRQRAESRVLIASFSHRRKLAVAKHFRGISQAGSHPHVIAALLSGTPLLGPLTAPLLESVGALFLPPTARGVPLLGPRMIAAAEKHQITLGAWTINDPHEMVSFWSRGVKVIVTDRTDLAVQAREEHFSPSTR